MAAEGSVLRIRALCAPAILLTALFVLTLLSCATDATVPSPTKANKFASPDTNYRSYHFVLLVKSEGSNRTGASSDVSEELVIMPADANLLERSTGGAIELKPQPLPGHITSTLLKKYQTNRSLQKRHQLAPAADIPTKTEPAVSPTASELQHPTIQLHTVSRGHGKKQRYPKKVGAVKTSPTTTEGTTMSVQKSSLRLLPVDDREDGLAPYEVVATSKGSLPAQPRTVRKTAQQTAGDGSQPKPRYEVIGTFRDAHGARTKPQRLSAVTVG
ncbi:phage integrase family protein [Anopheles sinensis]|uniref:Phage integrase family protein n=1 Tax=Anopheles sinensis TaxID=74873 RepID=A0A084WNT5_ANOSI|nr:phage integrase family protein [Anopheles sinensis]